MTGFDQYCDLLERGVLVDEMEQLASAVTTNETHFFREPHHFDALVKFVLPQVMPHLHLRQLRVWCAGCSTGQEAYTLAAVLHRALERHPDWRFSVLATDIDRQVLSRAKEADYPSELIKEIPAEYHGYFSASGGRLQVAAQLRPSITFRYGNLRETGSMRQRFDVIFCRNVVMYFHREFRVRLTEEFHRMLRQHGFLFLGTSESLQGMPRIFDPCKHGRSIIYRPRAEERADAIR